MHEPSSKFHWRLNVLAAKSHDGSTLVLRVVNAATTAINLTVAFTAGGGAPSSYTRSTLASTTGTAEGPDTDTSIWDPQRHTPVETPSAPFVAGEPLLLQPISFQIFSFAGTFE